MSACIDDNHLAGVTALQFSAHVSSRLINGGGDNSESFCLLVAGGKEVGVGGRGSGAGVVKAWKCRQQQQQQQQQRQKQPASNPSLQRFMKGALRFKKKEACDVQVCVDRDTLACFYMQDVPVYLCVKAPSSTQVLSSSSSSLSSSKSSTTYSFFLHICTSRSFRTLNLFPLPSLQRVRRIDFPAKMNSCTLNETLSSDSVSKESTAAQLAPYFDSVLAPLVCVLTADGLAVTLDEVGRLVARDLRSGRVVAVVQSREGAGHRALCLCHVPRSVREDLAGECSDGFPAFFVAHEGGTVGVYTHSLEFMYALNRLPPRVFLSAGAADVSITCTTCSLGNENSVLLLGLSDGSIVLYDLDGGDAAHAVTSAASICRSLPIVIEEASGATVCGVYASRPYNPIIRTLFRYEFNCASRCCSGPTFALARGKLWLKLIDVRRSRNVVASMDAAGERSIVAALHMHTRRSCLVMLLQVTLHFVA